MPNPSPAHRALLATLAATTAIVATACSGADGPAPTDTPVVVASTDVWAAVADAVGGEHADVEALYSSPDGDPHEYEASSADTARVQDANVLVLNGGHYDQFMETAAADARGARVVAADVRSDADRGNEHVFYDLQAVAETARAVARELGEVAPKHTDYYTDRSDEFVRGIDGLRAQLTGIADRHRDTRVVSTEPLAAALLSDAGLVDAAPAGFVDAVEEGRSPSAADRATFEDLLTSHRAAAMIYNTQAVDPVTREMMATARRASVPVVRFSETLPEGVTDYLAWQGGQIRELAEALEK
ncbi:metal ABC transporter solute-binding protein, Zn/Mn family [Gordonia shandongensis]|uniref:metal ABC transporter solute-binding protein, Zn/Mn family n=1 Tax=Gordonia shandongensis TaxID=376351 RepID=UPI0003F63B69|nr:zinc ABC transporter substrate-binding protein [Gordonia shandongensis]